MASYPWLPNIRIEAGLSGPTVAADIWHIGDPVRGQVGVAKIGPDNVWVDISYAVRSWSFRRGMNRGNGTETRYEAGTATIELNNGDRAFDPTNLTGPYAPGGVTTLLPMVRVRIVAEWDGVVYPLWAGLTDNWVPDYSQQTWSTTTLTATDAFKVFAGRNRVAVGAVGANEDSGARMGRVLDSIGWDTDDRVIETGNSLVQATTLEGSGLAELQLTAESEQGEFYVDATGLPTFRNRHAILTEDRSNTAQAEFGDAGIGTGEIPYAAINVDTDDVTLANRIIAQRIGGTEQVAEDAASEARFLVKEYPRSDLILATDAEALSWAQWKLGQLKDPELRFAQVGFNIPKPPVMDDAWPALLGRELGDRIAVTLRPPGGGDPNARDCWIRGIEMSSQDASDLKTTFTLQTTTRTNFWTIGHPTLGRVGVVGIAF